MTKEQEQAIETMRHWINYEKEHKNKVNKADELIEIQETVLNMLKEQDKETEKKDKIIDLMAERLRYDEDLKFEVCRECEPLKEELCGESKKTQFEPTELECVKQYFERKVEEK